MNKVRVPFNLFRPPVRLIDVQAQATGEIPKGFHLPVPKGNRTVLVLTMLDANLFPLQTVLSYGSKRKVDLQSSVGQVIELEYESTIPVPEENLPLFEGKDGTE